MLTGDAARAVGVSEGTGRSWFRRVGGVVPALTPPSGYRLSLAEREEIACLTAAGHGPREIGRRIGRPASTVSREVARNTTSPQRGYRAWTAQARAEANAARPKQRKLATQLSLRAQVQQRLQENHSPQQIANRLRLDYPNDPEMWCPTRASTRRCTCRAAAA